MAIPQTSINSISSGFPGNIVDTRSSVVETFTAQSILNFGVFVVKGNSGKVKLPANGSEVTDKFAGIVLSSAVKHPGPYEVNAVVPVLRRGAVFVLAEGAVTEDGPLFVVNGSGAGTPGALRGDANGGAATQITTRARIIKGASAGQLAEIEINLP